MLVFYTDSGNKRDLKHNLGPSIGLSLGTPFIYMLYQSELLVSE